MFVAPSPCLSAGVSMRTGFLIALAVVPLVCLTHAEHVYASEWSLEWVAPASCPDAAALRAAIEGLLGGHVEAKDQLSARASVTHAPKGTWRVHLSTLTGTVKEERVLDGATCRDVADATALVIALRIDPSRVSARPPAAPVAPATPPGGPVETTAPSPGVPPSTSAPLQPPEATAPITHDAPTPAATSSTRSSEPSHSPAAGSGPGSAGEPVMTAEAPPASATPTPPIDRGAGASSVSLRRFFIDVEASGALGVLPGAAYGLGLGLGVRAGRLRVSLVGSYWPAQQARVDARPTAGAQIDLISGGALAEVSLLRLGRVEIGPCVEADIGRMSATGVVGVSSPNEGASIWVRAAAGAFANVRATPWLAFGLRVEAGVPLRSPEFQLDSVGTVYESWQVQAVATWVGEVRF
jgi:hypothetical protein